MKMRSLLVVSAALLLTAGAAQAAHAWEDPGTWWGGLWSYDRSSAPRFSANELSLDLSGSYTAPERKFEDIFETDIRHGKWGGDVGLNYFITRQLGLSVDANMADNGGNLVDHVIGNAVLRLPIESIGLAPYVFGGGGRSTDRVWEWVGDFGVGLDFRMTPATGLFIDARYIWADKSSDSILFRGGLRLVF